MNAKLAIFFFVVSFGCAVPLVFDIDSIADIPLNNLHTGYQPEQPVPYSHRLHAGELNIDCQYCHSGTDESRHAVIPNLSTCMNCHEKVEGSSPSAKENIAMVRKHWAEGKPIEWVRVHNLPDFVYFNHSAHVNNARDGEGIDCEECHGDMKQAGVAKQEETLSMGWCVNCHRAENEKAEELGWMRRAPLSCDACHR